MKITKPNIRELVLKHGITFPSNEELIMLILGSGSGENSIKSISKKVSTILYDSAENEIVENLMKIKGMGSSKSLAIAAAIELGRRRNCHKNAVIKCPRDVVPFLKNYSMRTKEHFICVTLNGGHEIIQIRVIAVGTLNKTLVHPREIFSDALKENAASIIVCHNHPSGNVEPSDEDIQTTKNLIKAAKLIGIPLLDHIIIDKNSYFSFLEHELLFTE